ncbi:MAG: gentisate 1,2-dioxygenase, partial [Betaproteobacteria bacterium]
MNELRQEFKELKGAFVEATGVRPRENNLWPPVIISKEEIDAEVRRLASLPAPADGRRESLIVHPLADPASPGLAPGIQVKLSVLQPGEKTKAFRHNATEVNFCIGGGGHTLVGGRRIEFQQYDVWNHPSYVPYVHANDGKELQVRLTYSNIPLLQQMEVYVYDEDPPAAIVPAGSEKSSAAPDPRRKSPYGLIPIGNDGGLLMPYEMLINPTVVESRPLHFSWAQVKAELMRLCFDLRGGR